MNKKSKKKIYLNNKKHNKFNSKFKAMFKTHQYKNNNKDYLLHLLQLVKLEGFLQLHKIKVKTHKVKYLCNNNNNKFNNNKSNSNNNSNNNNKFLNNKFLNKQFLYHNKFLLNNRFLYNNNLM